MAIRNAMQSARALVPNDFRDMTFCGRPTYKSQVWRSYDPVTHRTSAWISNTATCKLTWVCPSCGSSHSYANQKTLERSIQGWTYLDWQATKTAGQVVMNTRGAQGRNKIALMTLTVRHDLNRPLSESLKVVLRAFTVLMNSAMVRKLKDDGTIAGYYRALEITYGTESGWHPHVHVLLMTTDLDALKRAWRTSKDEDGPSRGLKVDWGKALNKASEELGLSRRLGAMQRHQDLREASVETAGWLAGYLTKDGTKWSVASEMTRMDLKDGRAQSVSPRQLLVAAGNGDGRARRLWHEYIRATKGVHHIEASYFDFKARTRITSVLHEASERHERREANARDGYTYDAAGVANREDLEAQDRGFSVLSYDEQKKYDARDRDMEAAEAAQEPNVGVVASFESAERLSGKDGRLTFDEMLREPGLLAELLTTIETAEDPKTAKDVAVQFILERGLPVATSERVRGHRTVDTERKDYRERRADFEDQLMEQGKDEDEILVALEEFDELNKPFDRNAFMARQAAIHRARVRLTVLRAFVRAMEASGSSIQYVSAFRSAFMNVNSDERIALSAIDNATNAAI